MSTVDEKGPLNEIPTQAAGPPPALPSYQDVSPAKYPITGYPAGGDPVTTQPTYIVYQSSPPNYAAEYSRPLITLFILSSIACCFCWPLALVAFCFTIAAFVVASTNENPRGLMIAALVVVIAAFIIGIPLTIWYIVYRINNDDDYDGHDDDK